MSGPDPVLLCAACRQAVETRGPPGAERVRCPGCGLAESLETAEHEAEQALFLDGLSAVRRLDRDAPAGPARPTPGRRFVWRS